MALLIPFDARDPNTRLDPVLAGSTRRDLAQHMLADVVDACRAAGREPTVLATAPVDCDAPVEVDDRSLTRAVNAVLADSEEPVAVVMADLALATGPVLERFFAAEGDVVIAPGRGGGTNALLSRHPDFRVDYHEASFRDHCREARDCDASLRVVDSFRLAVDVDEPADLLEVLLHGEGDAATWLREAGFRVETADGEAFLARPDG